MMRSSGGVGFRDRHDAGRQLALALARYKGAKETIVLALPRGGVVVGYEISLALHVPLDVLVTRKLGTPWNPELAMGALAETGYRHLNGDVIREYRVTPGQIEQEVERQEEEIRRRILRYRGGRALPPLKGRTVILADDGIATGATFYASLAALLPLEPARLVAAVPIAPPRVARDLSRMVEEVVILETPEWFFGIGQFYEDFAQVGDAEVIACLEQARAALLASEPSTR